METQFAFAYVVAAIEGKEHRLMSVKGVLRIATGLQYVENAINFQANPFSRFFSP